MNFGYMIKIRNNYIDYVWANKLYEIQICEEFVVLRNCYGESRTFNTLQDLFWYLCHVYS